MNAQLDEYSGTYEGIALRNDTISRIISSENGAIRYHFDNYIFYPMKKDSFTNNYNNYMFFKRDSLDRIIGATRYFQGQYFDLEKVD